MPPQTETTTRYSQMSVTEAVNELQKEWDAFYNELPSSLEGNFTERATKIHTLIDVVSDKAS